MKDVRFSKILAGIAITQWIYRLVLPLERVSLDIQPARGGEYRLMPGVSGWKNTIEYVRPSFNSFKDLDWGTKTHKISGFVPWQLFI